jgi:alpha-beta hydrolase superfamily lysophospholipase
MSRSGEDDRTTLGTKGLKRTMKYLVMAGYQKLSFIEYPKMRHEILHEKNNDEVYKDILKFYGEE